MSDDVSRLRNELQDAAEEKSLFDRVVNIVPEAARIATELWEKASAAYEEELDKERPAEETPWTMFDEDPLILLIDDEREDGGDYDYDLSPLLTSAPATPPAPDAILVSGEGGTVDVGDDRGRDSESDEEPNYGVDNPFKIDDLTRDTPPAWIGVDRAAYYRFKVRLYRECVRRGSNQRDFVMGVPTDKKGTIRGRPIHEDLVADGERLMTAAETAVAAAKAEAGSKAPRSRTAEDRRARRSHGAFGLTSAYRTATQQFGLWDGRTNQYVNAVRTELEAMDGDPLSGQWVRRVARKYSASTAAPGYSLHQSGISLDFSPPQRGVENRTTAEAQRAWRATWFFNWLEDNASTYGFESYPAEAWHWNYTALIPEEG